MIGSILGLGGILRQGYQNSYNELFRQQAEHYQWLLRKRQEAMLNGAIAKRLSGEQPYPMQDLAMKKDVDGIYRPAGE